MEIKNFFKIIKWKEQFMDKAKFKYVSYISASIDALWDALLDPEITTKYWQMINVSDWKAGSKWEHRTQGKDAKTMLVGKVMEFSPPRKFVLTWADIEDEFNEEKYSRVTIELMPFGSVIRLTVIHEELEPDSDMLEGISDGWHKVISSLKSLFETGHALPSLWDIEEAKAA